MIITCEEWRRRGMHCDAGPGEPHAHRLDAGLRYGRGSLLRRMLARLLPARA